MHHSSVAFSAGCSHSPHWSILLCVAIRAVSSANWLIVTLFSAADIVVVLRNLLCRSFFPFSLLQVFVSAFFNGHQINHHPFMSFTRCCWFGAKDLSDVFDPRGGLSSMGKYSLSSKPFSSVSYQARRGAALEKRRLGRVSRIQWRHFVAWL